MKKVEGCDCFTCQHEDDPKSLLAYYKGYMEASEWFLNWAKSHNLKQGKIDEDSLESLFAQMNWNYMETACLRDEVKKELENSKEVIE